MAKLLFVVMSIFGLLSLSKHGVIAFSGFMLSVRRKMLRLCEICLGAPGTMTTTFLLTEKDDGDPVHGGLLYKLI